jgi:hypothetical protein
VGKINLGGRMPDGSYAQDLFVEQSDFICASGTMLSQGIFNNLLGKLCLTRRCLIMLPYEGVALEVVKKLADHLQHAILGPYADLAGKLQKLGLYAKAPQVLEKVLVWRLADFDQDAQVKELSFGPIRGGADLNIKVHNQPYSFNLKTAGHEAPGFASAQTFRDAINRLRR